jgi:hypothetical protein
MSDSLPRPLPSVNALRAHLKLLERGVNDARTKRVGPTTPPTATRTNGAMPGMRPAAGPAASAAQRPIPPTFRLPPRPASDKPKAKSKGSTDFAAFFEDVKRRAAS